MAPPSLVSSKLEQRLLACGTITDNSYIAICMAVKYFMCFMLYSTNSFIVYYFIKYI